MLKKMREIKQNNKQEVVDKPDETIYTVKIESPVYNITGAKPKMAELYDMTKTDILIRKIESSTCHSKVKEFLKAAAYRHCVFNYENIAEFYAHSDKETQELMEESALVIIDYKQALEHGFLKMTDRFRDIVKHDKEFSKISDSDIEEE